jgi:hypothetical protein
MYNAALPELQVSAHGGLFRQQVLKLRALHDLASRPCRAPPSDRIAIQAGIECSKGAAAAFLIARSQQGAS